MKDEVIEILKKIGYIEGESIFQQGSLGNRPYPKNFFTFWNFETPDIKHYDNRPFRCNWGFWIYYYSDNPGTIDDELLKAKKAFEESGWSVDGRGEDVKSDVETHTGRMITIRKNERY